MALTDNQKTIQDIFGIHLGREADTGGLDYWSSQLDAGKTAADVIRGIQSGSEYKGRENVISDYKAANAGAAPTESYIDARISPGGGVFTDPDRAFLAPEFAADNTWSSPLLTTGNNSWEDELGDVYKDLKIGGFSEGPAHYNTAAAENYGLYTGNNNNGNTNDPIVTNDPVVTDDPVVTNNPVVNNTGYLTASDLSSWWDSLDKPWLNQADDTANTNTSGNDDFMKLMMFMAMMRPQGGGGGFGQYGYGGLNPGGVQSAYNPMANLSSYMDAFKTLPGLSSSTISTGSN